MAREHHLDDAVHVMAADEFTSYPSLVLVLDVALGEGLWEIACGNPTWTAYEVVANIAALHDFQFDWVKTTPSGFIAIKA